MIKLTETKKQTEITILPQVALSFEEISDDIINNVNSLCTNITNDEFHTLVYSRKTESFYVTFVGKEELMYAFAKAPEHLAMVGFNKDSYWLEHKVLPFPELLIPFENINFPLNKTDIIDEIHNLNKRILGLYLEEINNLLYISEYGLPLSLLTKEILESNIIKADSIATSVRFSSLMILDINAFLSEKIITLPNAIVAKFRIAYLMENKNGRNLRTITGYYKDSESRWNDDFTITYEDFNKVLIVNNYQRNSETVENTLFKLGCFTKVPLLKRIKYMLSFNTPVLLSPYIDETKRRKFNRVVKSLRD